MENITAAEVSGRLYGIFEADAVLINEPMRFHTSFKAGGNADIMVLPKNAEEILKAVRLAEENSIPYYIIGNGSNILVGDGGIRGLVIKLSDKIGNITVYEDKPSVYAEAGAKLSSVAVKALNGALSGFEFAHGIPGTLGGAVMMNAGAYGSEMKDVIEYADVLDKNGNRLRLSNDECKFGYRTSLFSDNGFIVLGAMLSLKEGNRDNIKAEMDRLKALRYEKQPLDKASAGSTFKRPAGNFAGGLIEQAGLKGFRYGDAMVSDKHAGFVVNCGAASAADIVYVIDTVRRTVNERFGVLLEPEVRFIGEFHGGCGQEPEI